MAERIIHFAAAASSVGTANSLVLNVSCSIVTGQPAKNANVVEIPPPIDTLVLTTTVGIAFMYICIIFISVGVVAQIQVVGWTAEWPASLAAFPVQSP